MKPLETPQRLALIAELGQVIHQLALGRAEADDDALRTLWRLSNGSGQTATLPGIPGPAPSTDDAVKLTVSELFVYWQVQCGHGQAKATPERLTVIRSRLRDGYTAAEIRKAIDGAKHAAFEQDGKRWDDLTLICRNGAKLEDFITRGVRATGAIVLDVRPSTGGLDEQIMTLRRELATMAKQGRKTEYENANKELGLLLAQRGAKR